MQARLTTAVDGKQVGEILDDPLVWALCVPGVRGATPIAEPADDECRAKVDALVPRASRAIAATQQELRRRRRRRRWWRWWRRLERDRDRG
jgi:hypothetical protein